MWLNRTSQAEPSGLPMVDLILHLGVRQILYQVLIGMAINRPLFEPFLILFQFQHFHDLFDQDLCTEDFGKHVSLLVGL